MKDVHKQAALDRTFDYLTNAAMLVTMAETKRRHLRAIIAQLYDTGQREGYEIAHKICARCGKELEEQCKSN